MTLLGLLHSVDLIVYSFFLCNAVIKMSLRRRDIHDKNCRVRTAFQWVAPIMKLGNCPRNCHRGGVPLCVIVKIELPENCLATGPPILPGTVDKKGERANSLSHTTAKRLSQTADNSERHHPTRANSTGRQTLAKRPNYT